MNSSYGNSTLSQLGFLWACALVLMLGFSASVQAMPLVALTQETYVGGISQHFIPNGLLGFDSESPGIITRAVTVTGLEAGEVIAAIDARPATGQLYGLGITRGPSAPYPYVTTSTGHLYIINPTTGVATQVGTAPFSSSLRGYRFGFDFNPVTDEIRVTSGSENLRINPDTGQVISTDNLMGNVSDGSVGISALAYTANFPGAVSTTLYGVNNYDGWLVRIGDVNGSPISPDSGNIFPIAAPVPLEVDPMELDIAPTGEAFVTDAVVPDLTIGPLPFLSTPKLVGVNLTTGTAIYRKDIGTTPLQVVGLAVTPIQPGWWWNPNESGRGFSVEVSQNTLFMAGYLYDASGRATWYTSAGPITNNTLYQGALQSFGNGQTLSGPYKPYSLTNPNAGTITIQFSDATHGTLTWPGGTIPIERYVFGAGASSFQPESGWWWNASESGRGFTLEVQGNKLFIGGYMYDDQGNPVWYISAGNMMSSTLYQGQWEQYANGQTLTGSYKKPDQVNGAVGNITIEFTSRSTATLTLPDGRQIPLARYRF